MRTFFFISMLAFVLGANIYVFYRLCRMMPVTWGKIAIAALGVSLVACFVLVFVARNALPTTVLSAMYKIGTSWFFIFIYLLLVLLVADIARITHLLPIQTYFANSWIGFCSVTGLVAVIISLGYLKYENKTRVKVDVTLQKEAPAGKSLKIVAMSDLHLGYSIGKKEFEGWIELVNKENPDIILMAGDIIDNSLQPVREQHLEESFKKLKSRYGIFACMGNHEYISGYQESMEFLKEAGVVLLRDSALLVNNEFYVVGRDDRMSSTRKETSDLLQQTDRTKPIIMLDHQPYALEEVEKNEVDLQISGHTHRGQIWPISWITDMIYEKSHGYLQKGNSHIYVSSGIGIWGGKYRIGTQSEYVVINLTY
ncbi:metallophosphoesterase [Bacteroides sp. OttesenSCG-928-E20]|nr:metallophosphoesterase [Bacteroides sp. OttesenSCG-928-N06]MDL2299541.1 metallophosphoesterase [Bacteroides sp. OttesenSCG-928-E20]